MKPKQACLIDRLIVFILIVLVIFIARFKWQVIDGIVINAISAAELVDIIRLHGGFYLGLVLWALVLLVRLDKGQGFYRFYVCLTACSLLVMEFFLTMILRSTGSPLAFDILNHYNPWQHGNFLQAYMPRLFCAVVIPALIIIPLAFKIRSGWQQSATINYKKLSIHTGLVLLCFLQTMIPPQDSDFSKGIANTAIVYVVKTAINPVKDVLQTEPSSTSGITSVPASLQALPTAIVNTTKTAVLDNIVIIMLESVRAMSVSYDKGAIVQGTTPFMAKLAQHSLIAERAYVPFPSTSKAIVAINCGVEPFVRTNVIEATLGLPMPCMPKLLNKMGYVSASFHAHTKEYEAMEQLMANIGFNDFIPLEKMNTTGFTQVNYFGYEDAIMLNPSKQWLLQQKQPFVALYVTNTTHHPYGLPYAGTHYELPKGYGEKQFSKDKWLNAYHQSINYADSFIESLIGQYQQLGLYEDTIFVFVGDHGEGFGKYHRPLQHNNSLYNESIRIPLMIHYPKKIKAPVVVSRVVSQYDIVPTIFDLLQIETDTAFRGLSLLQSAGHDAIYSSCWYNQTCLARTDNQYKYIYNFDDTTEELYDLAIDPHEQDNIANANPNKTQRFRQQTHIWYASVYNFYDSYFKQFSKDYMTQMAPQNLMVK